MYVKTKLIKETITMKIAKFYATQSSLFYKLIIYIINSA